MQNTRIPVHVYAQQLFDMCDTQTYAELIAIVASWGEDEWAMQLLDDDDVDMSELDRLRVISHLIMLMILDLSRR